MKLSILFNTFLFLGASVATVASSADEDSNEAASPRRMLRRSGGPPPPTAATNKKDDLLMESGDLHEDQDYEQRGGHDLGGDDEDDSWKSRDLLKKGKVDKPFSMPEVPPYYHEKTLPSAPWYTFPPTPAPWNPASQCDWHHWCEGKRCCCFDRSACWVNPNYQYYDSGGKRDLTMVEDDQRNGLRKDEDSGEGSIDAAVEKEQGDLKDIITPVSNKQQQHDHQEFKTKVDISTEKEQDAYEEGGQQHRDLAPSGKKDGPYTKQKVPPLYREKTPSPTAAPWDPGCIYKCRGEACCCAGTSRCWPNLDYFEGNVRA